MKAQLTKKSTKSPSKKAPLTVVTPKEKRKPLTIGAYATQLLAQGKSTEAVVNAIKRKFPDAQTSPQSIAWYRTKLRQQGAH